MTAELLPQDLSQVAELPHLLHQVNMQILNIYLGNSSYPRHFIFCDRGPSDQLYVHPQTCTLGHYCFF